MAKETADILLKISSDMADIRKSQEEFRRLRAEGSQSALKLGSVFAVANQAISSAMAGKRQVHDWNASAWELSITMQRMDAEDAAVFGAWLESLNGIAGTFTFDLTPWCPGVTPAPGSRTFALAEPVASWEVEKRVIWTFQIDAMEVV
jgi:hypothetical protein